MLDLRDYQADDVAKLRQAYAAGNRNVCYQLATGGGKTIVFCYVVAGAVDRGRRVAVVVHKRELVRQASNKLTDAGVPHGIFAAGLDRDHDASVLVMSIMSVNARLKKLHKYPFLTQQNFIVLDEAHHARADVWSRFLGLNPDARILGVTATPRRTDGRGLGREAGGIFDALVCGPSIPDLVTDGWLAPARCFVPPGRIDVRGLRTIAGDWNEGALAKRASLITGDAVAEYTSRARGLPAIAFCCTVQHAKDVAAMFCANGYRADYVHGGQDMHERDMLLDALGQGEIDILTSCDLISEGLDVPNVSCIISLRPTQSIILHLQQLGRGMRPAPGKEQLIILDHSGNCERHGLPEESRVWTLEGEEVGEKKKGKPLEWLCDSCACLNPVHRHQCAHCGKAKPWRGRDLPEAVVGELEEISQAALDRVVQMSYYQLKQSRRSAAELHAYARAKGYKRGWVAHFLREQDERLEAREMGLAAFEARFGHEA